MDTITKSCLKSNTYGNNIFFSKEKTTGNLKIGISAVFTSSILNSKPFVGAVSFEMILDDV